MIFAKLTLIFMAIFGLSLPIIVLAAYSGNDSLGQFFIFVSIISSVLAALSAIAAAWVYFF